jgi:hypothetical protein
MKERLEIGRSKLSIQLKGEAVQDLAQVMSGRLQVAENIGNDRCKIRYSFLSNLVRVGLGERVLAGDSDMLARTSGGATTRKEDATYVEWRDWTCGGAVEDVVERILFTLLLKQ